MVHNNVIEKNKSLTAKMIYSKGKQGQILTCARSHSFSLLWRRGRWRRRITILSLDQKHGLHVDGPSNPIMVSHRMGVQSIFGNRLNMCIASYYIIGS
jgi:hypothetical protein